MAYRIEISPNNRAGCKNKECKDAGIKIHKGQLRFGTFVSTDQFQSWAYKHWGCVTPKQIVNIKTSVDDEPNNLDGYEDLPEDLQEKIRKALEDGHVADEDWSGDVEMNRAGKNGFRTPETKKARKEATKATEDGSASPSKPPMKKRSRVKEEPDAEDAENDGPPTKKKKASVKKETIKKEDAHQASEDEAKPAKRGRKKATNVKTEVEATIKHESIEVEAADALASPLAKTKAASHKSTAVKHVKDEGVQSDDDGLQAAPEASKSPPLKKAKASRKAAGKEKVKEGNNKDDAPPPVKRSRAPRKAKTNATYKVEDEEIDDVTSEAQDVEAPVTSKSSRASRKTKSKKDTVDEGHDTNDVVDHEDVNAVDEEIAYLGNPKLPAAIATIRKRGRPVKKTARGKKSNV